MAATEQNSLSIFSLVDALRRRKFVVLIPAILITAGAWTFARMQPDKYRGAAIIAASQTSPPEYLKHVAPPALHLEDHLWTVREVLFSDPVLQAAAREMTSNRGVEREFAPAELDELKKRITIKVEGEHTFQLIYDTGDRYDAMNVTNRLAELFIRNASARREQKTSETATVIDDQVEKLKRRMEGQSKQIHDFKTKAVTALPDHIDDNIRAIDSAKEEIREQETKIAEEEAKRASIQRELQDLEAKGVLDQPLVHEKMPDEEKLDQLRIQLGEFETRYTAQHPSLMALKRQIADLERTIASQPKKARAEPSQTYVRYSQLQSELEAIARRIEAYRRDQRDVAGEMDIHLARLQSTPQHEKVIEDMNRELKVGELQFHALLDKQLDTKLQKGFEEQKTGVAFTIVEPAGLPQAPYSPQRERLILMGLAGGLGLGLALAFVLEQNDTTFGNVDDFQAFTTLPVAGVVPKIDDGKTGRKSKTPALTIDNPESIAAEQYRVLAMRVRQQCDAAQARIITVTSAAGGEGKSITAINLATALAAVAGGRVLLIDADMRKPRIKEYLRLPDSTGKGVEGPNRTVDPTPDRSFCSLLEQGGGDLEPYIRRSGALYVIPGNVSQASPVAALSSPKARALFEQLKSQFEYIVVDAPPVLPIADSHLLAGLSDKVLFVVRARRTPRELFQNAVEGFAPASVLGAVLNDVDYQRSRYSYAYEYYKKAA